MNSSVKSVLVILVSVFVLIGQINADGTWYSPTGVMDAGVRHLHALTYDMENKFCVLYGGDDAMTYPPNIWFYDGLAWREEIPSTTANPDGRDAPGFCYFLEPGGVFSGYLLFGGYTYLQTYDDTWLYNYSSLEWHEYTDIWGGGCAPGNYPPERFGQGMAMDPNTGKVYMFGGQNNYGYLNDLWVFDPLTDPSGCPWSEISASGTWPKVRAFHGMCMDYDRSVIVVFGGNGPNGPSSKFNDTWEFDIASETWTEINCADHPDFLEKMGMSYDPYFHIVVLFGGRTPDETKDPLPYNPYYNETWEYDFSIPNWHQADTSSGGVDPSARYETAMAYDEARQVHVLYGGKDNTSTLVSDTWEYIVVPTPTPSPTPPPLPSTGQSGKLGLLFVFTLLLVVFSFRKIS